MERSEPATAPRPRKRTLIFAAGSTRLNLYLRPDTRDLLQKLMDQYDASAASIVEAALNFYDRRAI